MVSEMIIKRLQYFHKLSILKEIRLPGFGVIEYRLLFFALTEGQM